MDEMLIALAVTLIFAAIALFIIEEFDILSPTVVTVGIMGFSALLAALSSDVYNFTMTPDAALLLMLPLFTFVCSALYVKSKCNFIKPKALPNFTVKTKYVLIFSGIALVFLCLNLWELYRLSERFGNYDGIFGMIKTVRPYIEKGEAQLSRWSNYRNYFAEGLAYVSAFAFFYKLFFDKVKVKILLLPMMIYMPFLILSTGRMGLLLYVIYLALIGCITYRLKQNDSVESRKVSARWAIYSAVFFFLLFLGFGFFTGKFSLSGAASNPFAVLAHYGGASIPAFSEIMKLPYVYDGNIGSYTLIGVYRILQKFIELPNVAIFPPFVSFQGMDTNIYTAYYRYIIDFGVVGCTAIMVFFGGFYTFFYTLAKSGNLGAFAIIAYSAFSYPIFLFFQDERFFLDLFGTAVIYQLAALFFFYKIILRKG